MRKWFRQLQAKFDYKNESRLGAQSPNFWIQKSSYIDGWLHSGEHELLWDLAMRPQSGHVVEIGSWMGKSTCILAGACKERRDGSTVLCIDTFCMDGSSKQVDYYQALHGRKVGTFYEFKSNAERFNFDQFVIPIATNSTYTSFLLKSVTIRMAFIDGRHDLKGVREDLLAVLPGIVPGGVIAVHDVDNRYSEIQEAIHEVFASNNKITLIARIHCLEAYQIGDEA